MKTITAAQSNAQRRGHGYQFQQWFIGPLHRPHRGYSSAASSPLNAATPRPFRRRWGHHMMQYLRFNIPYPFRTHLQEEENNEKRKKLAMEFFSVRLLYMEFCWVEARSQLGSAVYSAFKPPAFIRAAGGGTSWSAYYNKPRWLDRRPPRWWQWSLTTSTASVFWCW